MKHKGLQFAISYIKYIFQMAHRERPLAAIAYVIRELFDLFHSLLVTWLVGLPYSYLGGGSRILGTKGISVGNNASIKRYAWIEAVFSYYDQSFTPSISIGHDFFASDRLHISAINKIEIGDSCLFGSGVYISDHNHGLYQGSEQSHPSEPPVRRRLDSFGPVIMGNNVWLGDNVIIVGPVSIGNGVVIGANSVVTRDVPDQVMAAGSPLRFLKKFNESSKKWEKINQ